MIIGVGSIGKRHFQSLINLNGKANFYLVDPIFSKIKKNRINNFLGVKSIQSNKKIFFYENINDWKSQNIFIDLCIISTNSNKRFFILNKVISLVATKYILLEKFLFDKLKDYSKALKICNTKSKHIFVNQWISQSSNLRKIFYKFKNYKLDFKVSAIDWGMASNILHFIDMVRYFRINNSISPKIRNANLSEVIRPAKRNGFYEVYGNVSIKYGKHNLYVSCNHSKLQKDTKPKKIDIEITAIKFKNRLVKFNLKPGIIEGSESINGKVRHFSEKVELMSELTGNVFKSLNKSKKIYLPTLEQSIKQHLIIFNLFSQHFKKTIKTKNGICPIT